ncbi:hypothetical protein MMYC01_201973 [Madurella mycetomatis]|uniref:DUF2470 domain-containing protein n=1 Tax=Madurella mycetomatis TaxID=100816 RepID=A0A175WGV7_9PEZI|nr:hypothetical protein MMYC01_201973 [Madurella mycetomatis]
MNKDHRSNMRLILQHYGSVPTIPSSYTFTGQDPKADPIMTDIDLSSFTVRLPASASPSASYAVPFDPPLASWDERRARLVEMTRAARDALPVVVDEYMAPRVPYDATIFGLVLQYFALVGLLRAGLLGPGTALGGLVDASPFPGGRAGLVWLVDAILLPVLAIHVAETWWLERSRLSKFGVRRWGKVWWLWMGSVFIEGAMAFKRFDIVVERLGREREEEKKGE